MLQHNRKGSEILYYVCVMINTYSELLIKWNKNINLIQKNTTKDIVRRHIEDSQQLCCLLDKSSKIIDIGSGAGFPGVILAINGFLNLILCEKNIKKITFLRFVKQKLNLKFEIFENIYNFNNNDYTAVSRAFGKLSKLCDIMIQVNIKNGIFHKGENYVNEIIVAKENYDFEYETVKSTTNNKSAIVKIFNVRRKTWEK